MLTGIFISPQKRNCSSQYGLLMLLFLLLFIFLSLVGCSHTKPYYRSDDLKPTYITVEKEQIKTRILLIGDAGEPQKNEPGLAKLLEWSSFVPEKTTVLFLGDNIYPKGMPEESAANRHDAERRIMAQINVIQKSDAEGIFIPGNHDWADNNISGRAALKREADFVNTVLDGEENFLPENECPDPAVVDLENVRLIVLDTHVWYEDEPEKVLSDCQCSTSKSVSEKLSQIMRETPPNKKIIVVGHHPLVSYGPRGGHFFWKDHLFPLTRLVNWLWIPMPVIGSLYPLARITFLKDRNDIGSPYHTKMKNQIIQAFSENKPLIYATGHDHTLQVLEGGSVADYLLVSGAGSQNKLYDVGDGKETLFAHSHTGFMAVDFLNDGRILLRTVEPEENEVVFELWLNDPE
jgi:hypothetical protein